MSTKAKLRRRSLEADDASDTLNIALGSPGMLRRQKIKLVLELPTVSWY